MVSKIPSKIDGFEEHLPSFKQTETSDTTARVSMSTRRKVESQTHRVGFADPHELEL